MSHRTKITLPLVFALALAGVVLYAVTANGDDTAPVVVTDWLVAGPFPSPTIEGIVIDSRTGQVPEGPLREGFTTDYLTSNRRRSRRETGARHHR